MKKESKWVFITPEIAAKYLERNYKGNRKLSQRRVDYFVQLLRDGLFRTTHQGIGFDKDGNLIDGQHRLWAIVESGIGAEMQVTAGLDAAHYIFPAIDIPDRRAMHVLIEESQLLTAPVSALMNRLSTSRRPDNVKDGVNCLRAPMEELFSYQHSTQRRKGVNQEMVGAVLIRYATAQSSAVRSWIGMQLGALLSRNYHDMSPSVMALNKSIEDQLGASKRATSGVDMLKAWKAFDHKRKDATRVLIRDAEELLSNMRRAVRSVWPSAPVLLPDEVKAIKVRSLSTARKSRASKGVEQASA